MQYLRNPYPSEDDYFKSNPSVAGMAAEDNQVVLNPYTGLTPQQQFAVYENELARIKMRSGGFKPDFNLTPQQNQFLDSNTYATAGQDDRRATIAARLFSGDSSAGQPTSEQLRFVQNKLMQTPYSMTEQAETLGGLRIINGKRNVPISSLYGQKH